MSQIKNAFEDFLFNIIVQSIENAYWRNLRSLGLRYERKQKIGDKFYWQCRKMIPMRETMKKVFKIEMRERLVYGKNVPPNEISAGNQFIGKVERTDDNQKMLASS